MVWDANMRKALAKDDGVRANYTGVFVRYGTKNGFKGPVPTVLLSDIRDAAGQLVCDHLWFNLTKGFESAELCPGDHVQFDARVSKYIKGYMGHVWERALDAPLEEDYKLSYPTRVLRFDPDMA
jgi:hypothetical protein